jgi:ribosomal protein S18 acetylase RimI-like enzyme
MVAIRAREWGSEPYWMARIGGYLRGEQLPQHALAPRAAWVAVQNQILVGFVAGHLTRRFNCDGELEWINVAAEHRGKGIADRLLVVMLEWFRQQNAPQICVDVEPDNEVARKLYARHGAVPLRPSWMVWRNVQQQQIAFDPENL